jgi:hypothetical protein
MGMACHILSLVPTPQGAQAMTAASVPQLAPLRNFWLQLDHLMREGVPMGTLFYTT